jgi:tetratricopeptide (TPR) repeat protein
MRAPALAFCFCLICVGTTFAQEHAHGPSAPLNVDVGRVRFATSCAAELQNDFERAVAMLHSFWYDEAQQAFQKIAASDPKCAIAYWGVGETKYHQLWGPNNVDDGGGMAAVVQARTLAQSASPRERGYIEAIGAYYDNASKPPRERALAYSHAMEKVSSDNPTDPEASVFYALSLIATADRSDKTFAQLKRAAAILKKVEAEQPEHPGVAHYLIHAYDSPELAELGLAEARSYARFAPAAPHALHMPTHIFTQLGLWNEAISTDLNAVAASEKYHAGHSGWPSGRLHSYDFLIYAYLQRGDDASAKRLVDEVASSGIKFDSEISTQHALAAIPARYALEKHDWSAAEKLEIDPKALPFAEAITRFARGMGAANLRHLDLAKSELAKLQQDESGAQSWRTRVQIESLVLQALIAQGEKDSEGAIHLLRTATEEPETAPGMPPAIVPCREILADLLFEAGHTEEALKEYEASNRLTPNRFHEMAGAFHAAKLSGNLEAAKVQAQRLLDVTSGANSERAELKEARDLLESGAQQKAGR